MSQPTVTVEVLEEPGKPRSVVLVAGNMRIGIEPSIGFALGMSIVEASIRASERNNVDAEQAARRLVV
jgi:hypothetical protein